MGVITVPACFLKGTRIRTPDGGTKVEDLKIGDLVETWRGQSPIKWIGRQSFKKSSKHWHESVLPVRISRCAINAGIPSTDLYLSPGHRLYLEAVLIEARFLVNGRSVVQAMPHETDQIEYFHIELEQHEVIFAEGAAVETFQLTNGREHFSNFVEYERCYGIDSCAAMVPYAPVVGYNGGRSELKAILRRAVSPIVDIRDPIQVAYDRIAAREVA